MKTKAYINILIATLFFSSMEVAIKYTNGVFNPIQLNFVRFLVGGLILMPFAIKKLKKFDYKLTKVDYIKFAFLGGLQIVIGMSFYTVSILYIPAHMAAIIFSCNTFFSIVFAFIILREKIYTFTVIALCFSFSGMAIISNISEHDIKVTGVVLCLLAAISFSLYGVLSKYFTKGSPIGGIVVTSYGFLFGVFELFILIMISRIATASQFLNANNLKVLADIPILSGISIDTALPLIFICVGVTGLGFASYFAAIDALPMSTVSLVFFIKPVLAPIFAFLALGEVIVQKNIIGLLLIVIGSCILYINSLKKN